MKVKLLRDLLVGPSDVTPTMSGTVVDLPEDRAKEYIKVGHAKEVKSEPKEADDKRGRKAK